jgi:hypothetical protein
VSLKDAEHTLKGMGATISHNTPGPRQLAQGFRETVGPVLRIWFVIGFLLLFGEPIAHWLAH